MSEELRRQIRGAMDAPMTDREAMQVIVSMIEVVTASLQMAPPAEQTTLIPIVIRAGAVIDHLRVRLDMGSLGSNK